RQALRGSVKRQLLREARVTGALEHPNIVPVHALLTSEEGAPLMVMKRVEGVAWGDRLRATDGGLEDLEQNLRILLQVCHAVHFAHTRGVLHRDLKPHNVMLGEFGEVYVVDWGTAVALRDDVPIEGLPKARNVSGVVGTLQYMAPEMVGGSGAELDERSDVYLLGAMLHEVLTGDPPHLGDKVEQLLVRAWQSRPYTYEPQVPAELA
ncbi:MAG: serine/threonine protein kinase, partial [Myxococcales bacterium]|nr:serine/threonine protein kinase [Myxococcales bacterium]